MVLDNYITMNEHGVILGAQQLLRGVDAVSPRELEGYTYIPLDVMTFLEQPLGILKVPAYINGELVHIDAPAPPEEDTIPISTHEDETNGSA